MLHVTGHFLAQTQSYRERPLSPMVAWDPPESKCSDVCSSSHPEGPGCSFRLMGGEFHLLAECRQWSTPCLPSTALELYHQYGIGGTWTTSAMHISSPFGKKPGLNSSTLPLIVSPRCLLRLGTLSTRHAQNSYHLTLAMALRRQLGTKRAPENVAAWCHNNI